MSVGVGTELDERYGFLHAERNRRLLSWMDGIPAPPLRISLFPTWSCNLKCKMCGVPDSVEAGSARVQDELPDEAWEPFIEEAARMGVKEWWISGGGDPLVRRELTWNIIRIIKTTSPDAMIELTTNGTRFTDPMIRDLVSLGLDKLQISIDGPDAQTHDHIRGLPGTFEKATAAIKAFSSHKVEMEMSTPRLTMNSVLNALNYHRMDEFIELGEELGVDEIIMTPIRITAGMRDRIEKAGMIMTPEQKKAAVDLAAEARKLAQSKGIEFQFNVDEGREEIDEVIISKKRTRGESVGPQRGARSEDKHHYLDLRCYETWYTLAIDPKGHPAPCCNGVHCANPDFSLKDHTMHEIWYGEYFMRQRAKLVDNLLIRPCQQCTILEFREQVGRLFNEAADTGVVAPFLRNS